MSSSPLPDWMICWFMNCSVHEACLMMELNSSGIFNFNVIDAFKIIQEHKTRDRNVNGATQVILICVYGLLIVSGLSANLVVSFVVARRPQMHTPRNLYIVNLTISDMTLCLICMPFTLVSILRRQWSLGLTLCKLVPVIQGANIMVSVGTITVIALDRYLTIVRGQETTNNKSRVITSIALVWLISALATLPLGFYQVLEPVTFHKVVLYETCIERWPSQRLKVAYAVAVLLVQAVIPALVVCVVHARIASYLHAHARTQKDLRRAHREIQRNRRTTLLLSGVAILFALSWLPLGIFSLTADIYYSGESYTEVTSQDLYVTLAVCHITAMSSAVSNPVVYGWLNTNIRQEFLQLLPSKCANPARQDEGTTKTALPTTTQTHRRDSVTVLLPHPHTAITVL
ncbi:neuropeptide F receptor-like [Macrosteles quadrilineatus]|uniref:neuropeptide F receptor-like n=1 Tax=Macrosteles quadrilineatus TaxID=74068 RepID=UPI0023E32811|nr:neuropeptide F receptor-like [Macrosteles quadrilineatus]